MSAARGKRSRSVVLDSAVPVPVPVPVHMNRVLAPASGAEQAGPVLEGGDDSDDPMSFQPGELPALVAEPGASALPESEQRRAKVDVAQHGQRLDRWLVELAPEFSRSHLQSLIADGLVSSAQNVLKQASRKVSAGEEIEVLLRPTAQSSAFRAEPVPLDIVYQDEHLMVLHKPAGLVVHPAAGNWSGTLLNGLLAHDPRAALLPRAGIVHRLDKDTSGLMVVARTLRAHTALVRAIAAREVKREYVAIAHGRGRPGWQRIDRPLGRDPKSRIRMAIVASGKESVTDAFCLTSAELAGETGVPPTGVSAWLCRLHTGRTHQIRVHLASLGHPLLGDVLYGGRSALGLNRQALHAIRLSFVHPVEGGSRVFSAALPPDLAAAWAQLAGAASEISSVIATMSDID